MLFALICTDKVNSLDLRQKSRPDHLKFLESLGSSLKAAGPFTDDEGKPTAVASIEPETDDEKRRQREAQLRRDNRLRERDEITRARGE